MFHLKNSVLALLKWVQSLKSLNLKGKRFYNGGLVFQIAKNAKKMINRLNQSERFPGVYCPKEEDILSLENKLGKMGKKSLLHQLLRSRIGWQYRERKDKAFGYIEYDLLMKWALEWKKNQKVYRKILLSKKEKENLKIGACYSRFVDLLMESGRLRNEFFLWTLRDGNPPEVFIEFPHITDWICRSDLSQRLGRYNKLLWIENRGGKKQVMLQFEGRPVSILDPEKEIVFRGSYKKTIAEIFEIFSNKYKEVGDFEVFADGIINWNTFKFGYWNDEIKEYILIDFLNHSWWENLPTIDILTHEQVEQRYKISMGFGDWVTALTATRGYINLSYEKTHAFLEFAVPDESGLYHIYDFGKYGRYFPKNVWDGLKKFTLTMLGSVMYPDENIYYTHRQRGFFPIVITKNQGVELMKAMRAEIFKCMSGREVYQVESENCAKWTIELLKSVLENLSLPNVFRMSLLDCEPGGLMQKLFNIIKKLPKYLQPYAITRLHYPIGAWRGVWVRQVQGKEWKSLSWHNFFNTAEVYLPALAIKKRNEGFFDIQTANLNGQTLWTLVCERVLHCAPPFWWKMQMVWYWLIAKLHYRFMNTVLSKFCILVYHLLYVDEFKLRTNGVKGNQGKQSQLALQTTSLAFF